MADDRLFCVLCLDYVGGFHSHSAEDVNAAIRPAFVGVDPVVRLAPKAEGDFMLLLARSYKHGIEQCLSKMEEMQGFIDELNDECEELLNHMMDEDPTEPQETPKGWYLGDVGEA